MRLDCVVMAGGRGERLGGAPKPLLEVCGKPMVVRVVEALRWLCGRVLIAYSGWTTALLDLCGGVLRSAECVYTPGGGYAEDLRMVVRMVEPPALVVPSDMPALDRGLLEEFLRRALLRPEPVVNMVAKGRGPTGLALFKDQWGPWGDVELDDPRLVDVDSWEDYEEVSRLCG